MKQKSDSNGLTLKERGPVWEIKVQVENLVKSVKTRNWEIKIILN